MSRCTGSRRVPTSASRSTGTPSPRSRRRRRSRSSVSRRRASLLRWSIRSRTLLLTLPGSPRATASSSSPLRSLLAPPLCRPRHPSLSSALSLRRATRSVALSTCGLLRRRTTTRSTGRLRAASSSLLPSTTPRAPISSSGIWISTARSPRTRRTWPPACS